MTGFIRDPGNGGLRRTEREEPALPFFAVMSTSEFQEKKGAFSYHKELLRSLGSIRYCKAEWFQDCIAGTMRIPQKSEQSVPQLSFGFYLTEQTLVFIEDSGALKRWVEKHTDTLYDLQTPEHLFLQLMELMIGDDILYLSHLEKKMEEMEATITTSAPDPFFLAVTKYRRKLSELNAYYAQLTAIGEQMQSHACSPAVPDATMWDKFASRTERLQKHVDLLRENVLQLRELFQSLQNARQNRVMGILTIVTTLFLPLTLLTGWYGMNFAHMPELQWEYGYLAVAAVAVVIVVLEILWFKWKRFF